MPIFGEFETVGEPVQATDERGHLSTVWQARKTSSGDNRLYAVKCYAARRGAARTTEGEEALDADRNLEFLEGVKQWRKVCAEGGRALAPVHDLGVSDQGAWYATDFYPRGSLKAWISRRGGVDSAALQQILYSVVSACRALKQGRGCSHGNIKPANIFLVGKSRPLRRTPFALSDPYPAAPLQLAQLDVDEQRATGDLLQQVMEAQDLRAMGELLLQLVEGRLVRTAYDYNYPIENSESWQKLGKHGEKWRELCNRLLDPQLSIETTNLDTLESELRPSPVAARLPLLLAGVGVVCAVVAVGVVAGKKAGARREARFAGLTNAASAAFNGQRYVEAWSNATEALKIRSGHPEMLRIQSWADATNKAVELARQEEIYRSWTNLVGQALIRSQFDSAISNADAALKIRPQDPVLLALRNKAQADKQSLEARQTEERNYRSLTNLVIQLLGRNEHNRAISNIEFGLSTRAQDQGLLALRTRAIAEKQQWEAQNAELRAYRSLTNLIGQQLSSNAYDNAISNIDFGLRTRSQDPVLLSLKRKAEADKRDWENQQAEERNYRSLTNLVGQQLARNEFDAAISNLDAGLRTRQQDKALLAMRTRAVEEKRKWDAQQEEARNYEVLTNLVAQLLLRKEYDAAISNLDAGLRTRQQDKALLAMRTRAVEEKRKWETQQAAERNYQSLTNLIGQQIARHEYDSADSNIGFALQQRQGDKPVLALRSKSAAERKTWETQQAEERNYQSLTNLIGQQIARHEYDSADSNIGFALQQRQGDKPVLALRSKSAAERKTWETQQAEERNYQSLTNLIGRQLAQSQYDAADSNIDFGLRSRRDDRVLLAMRTKAAADRKQWETQQAAERNYRSLTNLIGQLLTADQFDAAISNADFGLKTRSQDQFLLTAKTRAAREKTAFEEAQKERARFQAETNRIAGLISKGAYEEALSSIASEEKSKPGDPMLGGLRKQAEDGKRQRDLAREQFERFQGHTNQAGIALAAGDLTKASNSIALALKIDGQNPGAREIERLINAAVQKAAAEERQRRMNAAFAQAQNYFSNGAYAEVQKLCAAYPAEAQFSKLAQEATAEQGALSAATASFDRGDYAFTDEVKSRPYATKEPFKQLLESGEKERGLLNELLALKNKPDWPGLAARFKSPEVAAIRKPKFDELRQEAERNDPARVLNTEFLRLQVWFGTAEPQTINGVPHKRLGRGAPVSQYRARLNQLLQLYKTQKVEPPPQDAIDKLVDAMNVFQ